MERIYDFVYCDGDIIPSSEGILFEYRSGPQVITISDQMSLDALRKTIVDTIRGCKILLDLFTVNQFVLLMVVLNINV
ncbi:hypothetical protein HKD37_02G004785 [Glycine soja]